MRYNDSTAFRRALEDRLNAQAVSTGQPMSRLRKLVAFERLLARLAASQPGVWLLKGGLALQWRYAELARTTRDIDLLLVGAADDMHAELMRAASLDMETGSPTSSRIRGAECSSKELHGVLAWKPAWTAVPSRPFTPM